MPPTEYDIIRKVKDLGFATPAQTHLYLTRKGFFWAGYAGMGEMAFAPVSANERELILRLLGRGTLVLSNKKKWLYPPRYVRQVHLAADAPF